MEERRPQLTADSHRAASSSAAAALCAANRTGRRSIIDDDLMAIASYSPTFNAHRIRLMSNTHSTFNRSSF